MINLLPDTNKAEIKAARTNVLLIRYMGIVLVALVGILSVMYGSSMILQATEQSAKDLTAASDIEADEYKDTRDQVGELGNKLSGAKTLIDQEVAYSEILTGMASLMPEGTVISSITLDSTSFTTPASITAYAETTQAITELQAAFQASPLFSKVEFQTVSNDGTGIDGYPVSVVLSVTFSPGVSL